jgi:hypothetical protein
MNKFMFYLFALVSAMSMNVQAQVYKSWTTNADFADFNKTQCTGSTSNNLFTVTPQTVGLC